MSPNSKGETKIGLALSGGGSRAIAFHLGCLRALNDLSLLSRVSVLSSVSGGSVIAALWAYSDDEFKDFDERVVRMLKTGLTKGIVRNTLFSSETPKIIVTIASSGLLSLLSSFLTLLGVLLTQLGWRANPITRLAREIAKRTRRIASRSTAFERSLRSMVFGDKRMNEVQRTGLDVVINATELRSGTAFRYGSKESGCWLFGTLAGDPPFVSQAVASSAAFPVLLPAFDQVLKFEKRGEIRDRRVQITDGGVYENLGISCLLPGRNSSYSTNVLDCEFIIACDAGHGQPSGEYLSYNWAGRMNAVVNSIFRRSNNQGYGRLHDLAQAGTISGFVLPYLGQQDKKLPIQPAGFVKREEVADYPTDFLPMSNENIEVISKRGEQLTRLLVETYHPDL